MKGLIVLATGKVFNTATERPLIEEAISLVNTLPRWELTEIEELLGRQTAAGIFQEAKTKGVIYDSNITAGSVQATER